MPASYEVKSDVYRGSPTVSPKPKLDRKERNSMVFRPQTVSSWPMELSMRTEPYIVQDAKGNLFAQTITANNIYTTSLNDFLKYGYFSQVDDGISRGSTKFSSMDEWLSLIHI